jgi:BirA family biotin operon repressor/biotin-[acetyl-CoA-carboxylase] ligase
MRTFYKNYSIDHYQELDSTNKLAFEMAKNHQIKDRHIIMADKQSHGRGRYSRVWQSEIGNLYFSLLLRPKILVAKISELSFVAITALRLAIEGLATNQKLNLLEIKIENKWPNDLLINHKKVAGLLLESSVSQNNVDFVIIGIGLNLTNNPSNSAFPSSNLRNFGLILNQHQGLEIFLDQFEKLYQNYLDYGLKNIRNLWLKAAYRLNKKIMVSNQDNKIEGIFKDLDHSGNLILEHQQQIITINAADIYEA